MLVSASKSSIPLSASKPFGWTAYATSDLLRPLDRQGLLTGQPTPASSLIPEELDDNALLDALGAQVPGADIAKLRHVRSASEKREAEEIASRQKCEDFDRFAKSVYDPKSASLKAV